jgi:choline-glycine betaine transporter
MTQTQRIFAVLTSVATLLVILELVRRRRLKEEYSWLWILTALGMVTLSSWFGLIEWLTNLIGAATANTTLFLFGLLFLLLISVHFSTVLSRLTQQVRRLTQELAILSAERDASTRSTFGGQSGDDSRGGP